MMGQVSCLWVELALTVGITVGDEYMMGQVNCLPENRLFFHIFTLFFFFLFVWEVGGKNNNHRLRMLREVSRNKGSNSSCSKTERRKQELMVLTSCYFSTGNPATAPFTQLQNIKNAVLQEEHSQLYCTVVVVVVVVFNSVVSV